MEALRKGIDKFTEWLAFAILALMTVLVTWQVITRFVLKNPSTMTEALAKYLFLWLVLITAAYVIGKREHMSIEFFVGRFSKKTQVILGIISELVVLGFVIIVVTYGGGYIAMNAMSQMDSALPIPMGVVYLALPVSGVLSVFYALCNITDSIKKYKTL
jgi:TRAP-type C4-dicarboxylate transport system permease small subunit